MVNLLIMYTCTVWDRENLTILYLVQDPALFVVFQPLRYCFLHVSINEHILIITNVSCNHLVVLSVLQRSLFPSDLRRAIVRRQAWQCVTL